MGKRKKTKICKYKNDLSLNVLNVLIALMSGYSDWNELKNR